MASSKTEILHPLNPEQRKAALHITGVSAFNAGPGTGKTTAQVACAALKVLSGMEPQNIAMITFTNKAASEMQERLVKHIDEDAYRVFIGTFHQLAIKKILRPNRKADYLINKGFTDGFNILDQSDSKTLVRESRDSFSESQVKQFEFAGVDEDFLKNLMSKQKAQGNDVNDLFASIRGFNDLSEMVDENMPGGTNSESRIKEFFQKNYNARLLLAGKWWHQYEQLCIANAAMDFDDLLVNAHKLLDKHPEICTKLGRTFLHLQVDEYQDTSPVQFKIVKSIIDAQQNKSAIAVGDMRQAIYGFRGADSASMKTFVDEYNADVYPMNRNYRTAPESIEAINQFGETMENQLTDGKLVAMSLEKGPLPAINHFDDDKDEAAFIIKHVKELLSNNVKPNDISVIYRAKSVNREIKSLLDTECVQYDVIGDTDFYSTKEVKIAMSLLRLMVNENDRFALHNIMSEMPIGITKNTLAKNASEFQCSQMEALKKHALKGTASAHKAKVLIDELYDISNYMPSYSDTELAAYLKLSPLELSHKMTYDKAFYDYAQSLVSQFTRDVSPMFSERIVNFFNDFVFPSFDHKARKAAEKNLGKRPIPNTEYNENRGLELEPEEEISQEMQDKLDKYDEALEEAVSKKLQERKDNVKKFTEIFEKTVQAAPSFKDAVDEIMLLADNTKNNKDASIKLMTAHASKGLEFPYVIFAGAEQETFFRDEPDEVTLPEEERLLYVGCTRHKTQLIVTHVDTRFVNGQFQHYTPLEFLTRFAGKVESNDFRKNAKSHTINQSKNESKDIERKSTQQHSEVSDRVLDDESNKLISMIKKKKEKAQNSNSDKTSGLPKWVNDEEESEDELKLI